MNKTPITILLTVEEREELERVVRAQTSTQRDVRRARIILAMAGGAPLSRVAAEVGVDRKVVRQWATRFVRKRLRGLVDAPRSGRPPVFSPQRRHVPGEARM